MGAASPPTAADYAQSRAEGNSKKIEALTERIDELESALRRFGLEIHEKRIVPYRVDISQDHRILKEE